MNFINLLVINKVHCIWYYNIVPLLYYLSNVVQLSKVGPVSPNTLTQQSKYYFECFYSFKS